MQPEGEAIAGRVDRADERCKPPGPKTPDVKHGSKHLASKLCNIVNLDNGRCENCAISRIVAELDLLNNLASSAHFLALPLTILPRVLRHHHPDLEREPAENGRESSR